MSKCDKEGHKPGNWETEDNLQVRRCSDCNLILVTAPIPTAETKGNSNPWTGQDGGCRVS